MSEQKNPFEILYEDFTVCHNLWYNILQTGSELFSEEILNDVKSYISDAESVLKFFDEDLADIYTGNIPLRIGFVGGFNSGKSTIINSLLGYELLGMDCLPSTAKVTVLVYGEYGIFKKTLNGDHEQISYEDYSEYSVHNQSGEKPPKDAKGIDHFVIRLPNPILQQLELVDTPGFSTISEVDDKITAEWLNKVDVLFWVLDPDAGGTIPANEAKLLEDEDFDRIFLVINKADNVSKAKVNRISEALHKKYSFKRTLIYAAKPILDDSTKITEMERLIDEMQNHFLEESRKNPNLSFQILTDRAVIIDTVSKKTIAETQLPVVETMEFSSDYQIMLECLNEAREELITFKQKQTYSELSSTLSTHIDALKSCASLTNDHKAFYKKEKSKISKKLKKIEEATHEFIGSEYEDVTHELQSALRGLLFKIKGDGGFFGLFEDDYIVPMEITESKAKKLEKLITSSYTALFDDICEYFESLLEKDEINHNFEVERIIFDKFKEQLVESSMKGIATIQLWGPMGSDSSSEESIMEWINLLIPTLSVAQTAHLFVSYGTLRVKHDYSEYFDRLIGSAKQMENNLNEAFEADDN